MQNKKNLSIYNNSKFFYCESGFQILSLSIPNKLPDFRARKRLYKYLLSRSINSSVVVVSKIPVHLYPFRIMARISEYTITISIQPDRSNNNFRVSDISRNGIVYFFSFLHKIHIGVLLSYFTRTG